MKVDKVMILIAAIEKYFFILNNRFFIFIKFLIGHWAVHNV